MKKLTVAILIVGTFVVYSFVFHQSSGVALMSSTTPDSGSVASRVTPTAAGASSQPPTPTKPAVAVASTTASTSAATTTSTTSIAPTPTPQPTIPPTPTSPPSSAFKDGSYIGQVADAQWGYIQVKAVISNGRLTDVQFLQYPNDRSRSVFINHIADPMLKSEAIQAQSAQVDIISGATDSSEAFIQSLSDALSKAQS